MNLCFVIFKVVMGVMYRSKWLFGVGMCCTMVWADSFLGLGIFVGIIGIIIMGISYPVYTKITKKQREKIAPKILALTEELSK